MSTLVVIEKEELERLVKNSLREVLTSQALTSKKTYSENMKDNEAAMYLGVKAGTLRNWRVNGTGPVFSKIGRSIVYSKADLDNFLNTHKVKTF